ncbi:MAG: S1 RNA-binding domain-containing protein [Desulfovibrionaceae bacterium]|nr:S1 RNA-binding domain-containing protein [Desulfovibrionaceae bacterium]
MTEAQEGEILREEGNASQGSEGRGEPERTASAPPSPDDDASFADMLARQEEASAAPRLEPGQRVKATVVAVTSDTVFVSTGSKVDGIVEKAELEHDGISCAVGDVLDLYVAHVSPQEMRLSRVLRGAGGLEALEEAKNGGLPVEGKVLATVKGGFSVEIMRRRAFCPSSQMDLRPVDDPDLHLGKVYQFRITRMEQNGRNLVLSRRTLLEAEQAENLQTFLDRVQEGEVLEGTVRRLTSFGVFVELAPGVEGLAHVSELSWSKLTAPDETLTIGQNVRAKLLGVIREDKGTKISLSLRQVSEDPWNSAGERLRAGDTVNGRVTRLAEFGAFTEILPGIEGLIHLSELSWEKRVAKAQDVLAVGEEVLVKVKEVDLEKRRISLSLRDAAGDPWGTVAEDFAVDSLHNGRLEKHSKFGLFINLAPGITGLMPSSFIAQVRGKNRLDKLAPGDDLQVRIAEMDLNARKITLAPAGEDAEEIVRVKGPAPAPGQGAKHESGRGKRSVGSRRDEPADWKQHAAKGSSSGFGGSLGLALTAALEKKKK